MGKRIIIKTTLICIGVFLILNSVTLAYIFKKYPLDTEQYVPAVIAAADIDPGTVIESKHVRTKQIQKSAFSEAMETDIGNVIGKKTVGRITKSDYFREYDLLDKNNWYEQDERIIILPASVEERLANLIRKGSYIDIRLKKDTGQGIETILKKVMVTDMLDENGNSIDSITGINSRTAYMELVLGEDERRKVYTAITEGKLIYELYCDESQQ
jgi:hypothetical protein